MKFYYTPQTNNAYGPYCWVYFLNRFGHVSSGLMLVGEFNHGQRRREASLFCSQMFESLEA